MYMYLILSTLYTNKQLEPEKSQRTMYVFNFIDPPHKISISWDYPFKHVEGTQLYTRTPPGWLRQNCRYVRIVVAQVSQTSHYYSFGGKVRRFTYSCAA